MKTLTKLCRLPLHSEPMDAWLSKWGSISGGVLILVLSTAALRGRTSDRAELLLGIGMATVACSILCLFGVLARRVHLAWHRGAAPWRARVGELASLGIGVAFGVAALGYLPTLGLAPVGMIIGALLVASLAFAIMCLGLCSTLSSADTPPRPAAVRTTSGR